MKTISTLILLLTPYAWAENKTATDVRFIENGRYKLGVDMRSGGSVFWLSEMPDGPNLLNHADRGRFIQQSYYGKPDGTVWATKPWRWNPVQGGNYLGKPSKVEESRFGKDSLHVRSVPVHWVTGDLLNDCRMEQWITLRGNLVSFRYRFEYRGKTEHPPAHQELPAVFVDSSLDRLVYVADGKLKEEVPGWPNQYRDCGEPWAAFIGKDGRGIGIHFPGSDRITTYRHAGPSGPKGGGCSYFAPIRTIAIKPGFVMDYRISAMIGKPEEMREAFAKSAER